MKEHFVIVAYIVEILIISGALARGMRIVVEDASEVLAGVKELREAYKDSFYAKEGAAADL